MFTCEICNKEYQRKSGDFGKAGKLPRYCSKVCRDKGRITRKTVICEHCNISFGKRPGQITRTNHNFCSKSCSASWHNKNKVSGIRRSKAEIYLENQCPWADAVFNTRSILPSGLELDCYIPSIKTAIELNGPTHYKPIYGIDKFLDIQKKDEIKAIECNGLNIKLIVINVSQSKFRDTKNVLDTFLVNFCNGTSLVD